MSEFATEVRGWSDERLAEQMQATRDLITVVSRGKSAKAVDAQFARFDVMRAEKARRAKEEGS